MRLFFLTIPKPLKQHPIKKKIIYSAIFKDLEEKLPDPSYIWQLPASFKIGFGWGIEAEMGEPTR